jgi:hypothetical protein
MRHLIDRVKKLNNFQVFVRRITFYVELEIPLFRFLKGMDQLKKVIRRAVGHRKEIFIKSATAKGFSK